ncbi:MAG TPA: SDR family NAD(P)-dependent oxidoreductase [bacterium]|nr:SDR family NAD(P)-dependent oxidoreductase [bacterium]
MELKGKTALITGANRGLGFAMSEKLASMGARVFMACRKKEDAEKAVSLLASRGLDAAAKQADVENPADIEALSADMSGSLKSLDILINNAGVNSEPMGTTIENIDLKLFEKIMNINLRGALYMCSKFIPLLKNSPDARIINFSSGLAQLSVPRMGPFPSYSISKTGVNQLTWFLAEELKETNVKVFSVDPGWVKTDMGGPNAMLEISEGIDTPIWLATAPAEDLKSGCFYKERKVLGW